MANVSRSVVVWLLAFLALACASGEGGRASSTPTTTSAPGTPNELSGVPTSCPVTVPGDEAFTPRSEIPAEPPEVYDVVWYGTPGLWTMLDATGEVNSKRWLQGDKTFWWSTLYTPGDTDEVVVSAEHLSGSAPTVVQSNQSGNGFDPFMLSPTHESVTVVGVELPETGCWEISGSYKGTDLSYVVWFDQRSRSPRSGCR